jgi:glycosyltransferase involved in cell wall biosynthesis
VAMGIPSEKIEVVPHGDYSFFRNYTGGELPRSGKKTVLFFGRIEPYKGIEYFIEAAKKANINIPDSTFIIAGDGDLRPYRGLIDNNVIFNIINRYIDDREVAELFSTANFIVLPYISATQSGIIPIAYAFKKPVIVTSVGSLPEVVEDGTTGLIVPPKDVETLSSAIIKLLKDDKLAKTMGENAYRKMNNELSWDLISRKLVSIYSGTVN